jgi:hypothetical protein
MVEDSNPVTAACAERGATTFSITALSIMTLRVTTFSIIEVLVC